MADSGEPPAKQQRISDLSKTAGSSDPAEPAAWDTWLDVSSLGVHCGHGPVKLAYTLTDETLVVGFWPAEGICFKAELLVDKPSGIYDLVDNVYNDDFKPKDGGFYPSRAFFFFLVYVVVHRLKGAIVARKNERAGYVLSGRPPRAIRNNEYYGNQFELDQEGAHKHFYLKFLSNAEYLKLAKRCYGWTYDDHGSSFRMMNDRGFMAYPMCVLLSTKPEESKDLSQQGNSAFQACRWHTRGVHGQMLPPDYPLAAVGWYHERMSCVTSRPESNVLRVRGIHSVMKRNGAKILFRLLQEMAFDDDTLEQRLQLGLPADIDAIMPYSPMNPMTAIFCWDLGALPSTTYQDYILPNRKLFASL